MDLRLTIILFIYFCSTRFLCRAEIQENEHIEQILSRSSSLSTCESWCRNGGNCAHELCQGCEFTCGGECNIQSYDSTTCAVNCKTIEDCDKPTCANCQFCLPDLGKCPLGTFKDVTQSLFSEDPDYWNQWKHSGKPYPHEGPALFFDVDGDFVLDYFHSLHGHSIDENRYKRMELALTKFDEKNENDAKLVLHQISHRIIIDDDPEIYDTVLMDPHNEVIMDLDGDGLLDIYIAAGSNLGEPYSDPEELDNFLLFGEERLDEETGETALFFRGGRNTAAEAALNMRDGRGRFSYIFDANGDGLLDVFTSQSRRVDNTLAPGVLLINQGNRTWREDRSMMEFASTLLLTDADGDGLAQEVVIARDFCFSKRPDPNSDAVYGAFSEEVKEFCSTRPIGTTAVYKWNPQAQKMLLISTPFHNIQPGVHMQPACCPHGLFDNQMDCSAISMASGDVDGDRIADHVFLYGKKLVFYFSSDRRRGILPTGKENIGLTIDLPDQCSYGKSIRFLDMDNSGRSELIVICRNAGSFLVYTQGATKKDWTLENNCNSKGSLGDLVDVSLAMPNEGFLNEACQNIDTWRRLKKACKGKPFPTRLSGVAWADVNNDGFTDAIVSYNFGYHRFFFQEPSAQARDNHFIAFQIIGDGKENNIYGIGATLVLVSRTYDGQEVRQFREVSTYQHTSDKSGSQDPRVIFGLGKNVLLDRLIVKWPNGKRQVAFLGRWEFKLSMEPIHIRYFTKETFVIKSYKPSGDGEELSVKIGYGKEWNTMEMQNDDSPNESVFYFDNHGRLVSKRYPNFCVGPVSNRVRGGTVLKLILCKESKSSWQITEEGRLMLQGSDWVLDYYGNTEGEKPRLRRLVKSRIKQQWYLQQVKR